MSNFPSQLDTDIELPPVIDNITEQGSEAINALREAIFAIEAAVGINPQGSQSNLADRLSEIINPDGTFKSTALIAAGLIALPITNSMIAANAGIEESKLDLIVATQVLQDQLTSDGVDIAALQTTISALLAKVAAHIAGTQHKHDGYAILLDDDYSTSVPPALTALSSINVSDAIVALKRLADTHSSTNNNSAHLANNIAIVPHEFLTIDPDNVQEAIEQLDEQRERELISHRDEMHANGFGNYADEQDGYDGFFQKVPVSVGTPFNASIPTSSRNIIEFDTLDLDALGVKQGDMVVIASPISLAGNYSINDVGPRSSIGGRGALAADQIEIFETLADDGNIVAFIFGPSSVANLKGNMAPTIRQSDINVDSIQVSRPNSARVVSLGIDPTFITSTHSLTIEVGTGSGGSASIVLNNLHYDRSNSPATIVSLDTIIERINYILHHRSLGNIMPITAYRIGDELMISHNWNESVDYYINIPSAGAVSNTLFILGLDQAGADVVDKKIRPTRTEYFYVAGTRHGDVATILEANASVAGQTITFGSDTDPLALGVKVGHLLHIIEHSTASQLGTYFISSVGSNNIVIQKNAGITTDTTIRVRVLHDAVALDENAGYTQEAIFEIFYDSLGRGGFNLRASSDQNITGISMIDISDNFISNSSGSLVATLSSGDTQLVLGGGAATIVPSTFNGSHQVKALSNVETITLNIDQTVGVGTNAITVYDHIDEEEVVELCLVRFDGVQTLTNIKDKRLFGSTGLKELREDITQAYVETPIVDLRSNGVIDGFDLIQINYQDVSSYGATAYAAVLRGGTAYVGGVRVSASTTPVFFVNPPAAAVYFICLDPLGKFVIINQANITLAQLLMGFGGPLVVLAKITHSDSGLTPLSYVDQRQFINNIDNKLDLIVDIADRHMGSFNSGEAAFSYASARTMGEKCLVRIISDTSDESISIPLLTNPLSVQIDGAIEDLTVGTDCRIFGIGVRERTDPHIAGDLTVSSACEELIVENIYIAGTTNITFASASNIRFINCKFGSGLTTSGTGNNLQFINCNMTGTITVNNAAILFDGCYMSSASIINTTGQSIDVANCEFESMVSFGVFGATAINLTENKYYGSATALTLNNTALITKCLFSGNTVSSGTLIDIGSTGSYMIEILECIFLTTILSGTATIIKGNTAHRTIVKNCLFDTITFTANTAIIASEFVGNILKSPTGNSLIKGAGSSIFNSNHKFHTFSVLDTSSELQAVSNNIFLSSSLGYNIDLTGSVSSGKNTCVISNNIFVPATSTVGILCSSNTRDTIISGNHFRGAGIAIDLQNAAEDISINGNYIDTFGGAFSCSNPISSLKISNNRIDASDGYTSFILQPGSNFEFSNNYCSQGIEFVSAPSISQILIDGNEFSSSVQISATLTNACITNNIFNTLEISTGDWANTVFSDNQIVALVALAQTKFSYVVFSNNNISTSASTTNIIWDNSSIISNIIIGSSTFKFNNASLALAKCIFVANNVSTSITVTSTDSIVDTVSIIGNITGTITIDKLIQNSIISKNQGADIIISAGCASAKITDNIITTTTKGITISGTMSGTSISGNDLGKMIIDSISSSSNNIISNNNVSTTFRFFSVAGTTYSFTNSTICGNRLGSSVDMVIGSTVGATTNRTFTNIIIDGNSCRDINILSIASVAGAVFTAGPFQIVNNKIDSINIFPISGAYSSITTSGFNIISNNIVGNSGIAIASNIDTPITFSHLISNNTIAANGITVGDLSGSLSASRSGIVGNIGPGTISVVLDNNSPYIISGNSMTSISFKNTTTLCIPYISNNICSAGDLDLEMVSTSRGFILNNDVSASIVVTTSATANALQINNNTILDMDLSGVNSLVGSNISNNIIRNDGFIFGPGLTRVNISGNVAQSSGGDIDLTAASGASAITKLFLVGNILGGEIALPDDSAFATGTNQSKFIANVSGSWTSAGTISTDSANFIFPWGNTSGSATSVTFDGTTATNTATANDINGGGIDC